MKKIITHLTCVCLVITGLTGCARPVTQQTRVHKDEITHECEEHKKLAKNAKPDPKERKVKELSHYHLRLERLEPRLSAAAKKVCLKGKCEYNFKIADEEMLNAWADGRNINVTPMMLDFFEDDLELSVILAHELAHNVMRHINKKQTNMIMGTVVDIIAATQGFNTQGLFGEIGARGYSQSFENEADYVAIYIMANADYDISNLHNIWRKMSSQESASIKDSFFSTHPSNPERYLRMQKTIAEVQAKKAAGKPLLPNMTE